MHELDDAAIVNKEQKACRSNGSFWHSSQYRCQIIISSAICITLCSIYSLSLDFLLPTCQLFGSRRLSAARLHQRYGYRRMYFFGFRADAESDAYVTGGLMVTIKRSGSSEGKQEIRISVVEAA